jgi:Spy/CpxP family protein refolding chaperone
MKPTPASYPQLWTTAAASSMAVFLFVAGLKAADNAPPRAERPNAERPRADRPERPAQPPPAPGAPQRPGFFPFEALRGLDLNDEQRTAVREAMDASREDYRAVGEKVREARRALENAVFSEKLDEPAIREKAAVVGKLETEVALLNAKTFAKIHPVLTAEQLARLKQLRSNRDRVEPPGLDRPRGPQAEGDRGPERPRRPNAPAPPP